MPPIDVNKIGADRQIQDPQDAIDAAYGTYKDPIPDMTPEQRLPLPSLPQAPQPKPYSITGTGTGGR